MLLNNIFNLRKYYLNNKINSTILDILNVLERIDNKK